MLNPFERDIFRLQEDGGTFEPVTSHALTIGAEIFIPR